MEEDAVQTAQTLEKAFEVCSKFMMIERSVDRGPEQNAIKRDVSPTITTVRVLMRVAREPGLTVTELARTLDMPISTLSRMLSDLGKRNRNMSPGFGLIEPFLDDVDFRMRRYKLTPKGSNMLEELSLTLKIKS